MKYYSNNHYNPELKAFARELRSESVSKAEKYIWKALLSRKQTGQRFLRQRPIDRFIADFFAPEVKLIIEIDGSSHWSTPEYDRYREDRLRFLGYELIRFTESEVLNSIHEVSEKIRHVLLSLEEKRINS